MTRSGSIRNRILAVFFVALLILLLVFLPLINSLVQGLFKDNAKSFTRQMILQVSSSIDIYVDEMSYISDYIMRNPKIKAALDHKTPKEENEARTILENVQAFRPDFITLAIFTPDGRYLSGRSDIALNSSWDFREMDWYNEAVLAEGKSVLSASHVSHLMKDEYPWVVSLSRAIYQGETLLGVLLIDLNYAQIEAICSDLDLVNNAYVFILGSNDELVYHPQQQLIYSGIKHEPIARIPLNGNAYEDTASKNIYLGQSSGPFGWRVIGVVNTKNFFPTQFLLWGAFAALIAFFILVYFAVNLIVKYNIHEPLRDLNASIRAFQRGNFGVRANIHVNNELDMVGDTFNTMTGRIEALMSDSKRIAEEKRKSELQTLQAQIRPHFLYNTLESIIWTAELGQTEEVISMTSSLAKLLRATNADADHLITLRQEMDYAQHYLIIQKMRYREKLEYTINLPRPLEGAKVLQLCLQPLVENSLYHGLKPLKEGGKIVVDAWVYESELLLRVVDNGLGFDLGQVQADGSLPKSTARSEGGLGLINVLERLRLYFGPDYGMSFISRGKTRSLRDDETFVKIMAKAPSLSFTNTTAIILHLPYFTREPGKEWMDDSYL